MNQSVSGRSLPSLLPSPSLLHTQLWSSEGIDLNFQTSGKTYWQWRLKQLVVVWS